MPALTEDDLKSVGEFIGQTRKWLKQNEELARGLGMYGKFMGPLGEGLALIRLCKSLGSEKYEVSWPGRHKKGYDLQVALKDGKSANVQVKTTSTDSPQLFTFRGMAGTVEKTRAALNRGRRKFRIPEDIWRTMEDQVDKKFPDSGNYHWIIVSIWGLRTEFFVLNKSEFKRFMRWHREKYLAKRNHLEGKGLGVNKRGILQERVLSDSGWKEYLRTYKDRFDKIVAA